MAIHLKLTIALLAIHHLAFTEFTYYITVKLLKSLEQTWNSEERTCAEILPKHGLHRKA